MYKQKIDHYPESQPEHRKLPSGTSLALRILYPISTPVIHTGEKISLDILLQKG